MTKINKIFKIIRQVIYWLCTIFNKHEKPE